MPSNNAPTPTHSPEEFCLGLKAARERKGITLADIANSTKLPVSMFVALERGDLRRWPKGLFKRSFFRGYVKMIDVPVAEAFAEFIRLFPDYEAAELPQATAAAVQGNHEPSSPLSGLIAALSDAISSAFGTARSTESVDDAGTWVTDARRIGPSPRVRVRIKVPK